MQHKLMAVLRVIITFLLMAGMAIQAVAQNPAWTSHAYAGLSWTEGWSTGSIPCVAFTGNLCTQPWSNTGTGTPASLAAIPCGTPSWTQSGPTALKMVTVAAQNNKIITTGYIPNISSGSALDIFFSICWTSNGLANNNQSTFLVLGNSAGGNAAASIQFTQSSGNPFIEVSASTQSSNVALSLNTIHNVQVHLVSGAAASFLSVDGGTHATFTENAQPIFGVGIGSFGGNLTANTYYIGNMRIDSAGFLDQHNPPDNFVDFAGETNGGQVTAANIVTGTHGHGGCSWTGTATANLTYDNGQTITAHSPVTAGSVQYLGNSGLSMKFNMSDQTAVVNCGFTTLGSLSTVFLYLRTDLSANIGTTAIYSLSGSNNDFAEPNLSVVSGQLKIDLEYQNGGSTAHTATINLSTNTWYAVRVNFICNGLHTMTVWETSGFTSLGTVAATGTTSGACLPSNFGFGHTGAGNVNANVWYSNIVMDYTQGRSYLP